MSQSEVFTDLFARSRSRVLTLACVMALGAGAVANLYPSTGQAAPQQDRIGQICHTVVGVEPGEARYGACVASLSDSARNVGRGRALDQARADCRDRGMRSSGDLAVCEVQSADDRSAADPELAMNDTAAMQRPGLAKPYPYASFHEVHRREGLSCARLGLDPAGVAFAQCVAGLDSALFAADNPMQ